jgi:SSS family solute:Na+ symporter
MYAAFAAIIINLVLAIILTPIFNGIGLKRGTDATQPTDYDVEVELPEEVGEEALS